MSESSGEIEKRGGTPDVPHLIRAGGEWAVLAYREFLDNPNWSAAKRTVSRNVLGRFCGWAEARGLTLESISASEVKAYFAETPEERYLAPVGDLLRRLAAAGVVTGKPVRRKAMRKKATAVPEIIRAAGERAVAAYREILDDPKWSAGTRRLYGRRARRFFRWAEAPGLSPAAEPPQHIAGDRSLGRAPVRVVEEFPISEYSPLSAGADEMRDVRRPAAFLDFTGRLAHRIFTISTSRPHLTHSRSAIRSHSRSVNRAGRDVCNARARHARSPNETPASCAAFHSEATILAWASSKGITSIRSRSIR